MEINIKLVQESIERLKDLEDKFDKASVGEHKQFYFNVGVAVLHRFINMQEIQCEEFDNFVHNSKLFAKVFEVVKNRDALETNYRCIVSQKLNDIEANLKQLHKLIELI